MTAAPPGGLVAAVCASPAHTFSKPRRVAITLLAGLGVAGDAHCGARIRHRSRLARDPKAANLRQVHLIHGELLDELAAGDFAVAPGDLGENVTTGGLALLELPAGTHLHLGAAAIVEITGLRNPCAQLDAFRPGLMAAVLERDAQGRLLRKAGVMGVVVTGGEVRAGDAIVAALPSGGPPRALAPV